MIKFSKHSAIIYTNHEISSVITAIIKLMTFSTNQLNMKLIRAFMYLFQFRLNMKHRSEKFNVISNALSRLSITKDNISHEALNLNQDLKNYQFNMRNSKSDQIYAYATTLMKMSQNFRNKITKNYQEKSR
jgi:superfamily II helicase